MSKMSNLDFKGAGFWPRSMKMTAYAAAFLGVLTLAWVFWFSSEKSRLDGLGQKESDLKSEYESVQEKANKLDLLKKQLIELDDLLKTLVKRLPSKNEIPELVINVSQTAMGGNLNVDLFKPLDEAAKEFYAEKKINVSLRGDYHQLAGFFNDVAKQPRLVAVVVDDMKISVVKPDAKTGPTDSGPSAGSTMPVTATQLKFDGSVRTYRYLSDDELANAKTDDDGDDKKKKGKKAADKKNKAEKKSGDKK